MSAFTRLVLESNLSAADTARRIFPRAGDRRGTIARIARFLRAYAIGAYRGTLELCTGAVKSAATISVTGNITAADTFILCGQTFTARGSGAVVNEFNIAAGDVTTTAANIAAAINASDATNVTGSVSATSALGVVTIKCLIPGKVGNGLRLSESLTNATRVDFAGGSDGTRTSIAAGGAS